MEIFLALVINYFFVIQYLVVSQISHFEFQSPLNKTVDKKDVGECILIPKDSFKIKKFTHQTDDCQRVKGLGD